MLPVDAENVPSKAKNNPMCVPLAKAKIERSHH